MSAMAVQERLMEVPAGEGGEPSARQRAGEEKTFRPYDPDQVLLMAPVLSEWVPEGDLAHFVSDLVETALDLGPIYTAYEEERGSPPYDPRLMLKLLVYGYANGVCSSRKLEAATYRDVGVRMLCADQHPDYRSIARFRARHLEALSELFVQALRLCKQARLVGLGTLAVDGTKLRANASRHKAMSYERMVKKEAELESARRAELAAEGKKPRRPRDRRDPFAPKPGAQRNFTDPGSKIMKTSDGAYHQCFNGQATVDSIAQVIVAAELSDEAPDARLLEPALEQLAENLDAIEAELPDDAALCADAGYFSEENVRITAQYGLDAHIATGRFKHSEPPPPAPRGPIAKNATPKQRMARKLRTNNGRATYARRKAIVEPVFGQMETVQDARRLLLRGKPAARAQWRFHCAIHNLLKLHRAGGLDLVRERNSPPPSPSAGKRRPLATAMHSLAARFRRSLATMSTDRLRRIAPIPVTDPGS